MTKPYRKTKKANGIKRRFELFLLYKGLLYKKAFCHPLLRCTTPEEAKKILDEIHEGECESHIRG